MVQGALVGRTMAALDVYSADDLAAIRPALAAQARLDLVPTPNPAPDRRPEETRGRLIHAAAPVRDAAGGVVGALEAGVLLNRNLDSSTISMRTSTAKVSLPLGSRGTTTLILEGLGVHRPPRHGAESRPGERRIGELSETAARGAA